MMYYWEVPVVVSESKLIASVAANKIVFFVIKQSINQCELLIYYVVTGMVINNFI